MDFESDFKIFLILRQINDNKNHGSFSGENKRHKESF